MKSQQQPQEKAQQQSIIDPRFTKYLEYREWVINHLSQLLDKEEEKEITDNFAVPFRENQPEWMKKVPNHMLIGAYGTAIYGCCGDFPRNHLYKEHTYGYGIWLALCDVLLFAGSRLLSLPMKTFTIGLMVINMPALLHIGSFYCAGVKEEGAIEARLEIYKDKPMEHILREAAKRKDSYVYNLYIPAEKVVEGENAPQESRELAV